MDNIPAQWLVLMGIAFPLLLAGRLWLRLQRQEQARRSEALRQLDEAGFGK